MPPHINKHSRQLLSRQKVGGVRVGVKVMVRVMYSEDGGGYSVVVAQWFSTTLQLLSTMTLLLSGRGSGWGSRRGSIVN